jgi:hypothetical protein
MKIYDFECVILTTAAMGTPWMDGLVEGNPGLVIHVHSAPDPEDEAGRMDAWRNCDRNVREWWRGNREKVVAGRVLFLEWDVFVSGDLEGWVPLGNGLHCARVKMPVKDRGWSGFREVNRLPRELRGYAIGCEPSAVLMLSRDVLDEVADAEWDDVFSEDIISEIRLGTVARFSGYAVAGFPPWAGTVWMTPQRVPEGFSGVLHPLKKGVAR